MGQLCEQFVYSLAILGTCDFKDSSDTFSVSTGRFVVHFVHLVIIVAQEVHFVAHHRKDNISRSDSPDLFCPNLHLFEGTLTSDIIDENCDLCVLIVNLGDWSVFFLPGCIPDLHFYMLPRDILERFFQKCSPQGGRDPNTELILGESSTDTGLPHSRCTHHDYLHALRLEVTTVFAVFARATAAHHLL